MTIARRPARSKTSRRRRGFFLIELLVVMSSVTIVLVLCAITIQLLMNLNADGYARLSASAGLARLSSQFRADVHACDDAQLPKAVDKPAASLRLASGPRMIITYEARDGLVARDESTGGTISRHESYLIGKGNVAAFERRTEGPRRFVVMVVSHRSGKGPTEPPRPIEVLALQGKDQLAIANTNTNTNTAAPGSPRPEGGRPR